MQEIKPLLFLKFYVKKIKYKITSQFFFIFLIPQILHSNVLIESLGPKPKVTSIILY